MMDCLCAVQRTGFYLELVVLLVGHELLCIESLVRNLRSLEICLTFSRNNKIIITNWFIGELMMELLVVQFVFYVFCGIFTFELFFELFLL